MTFQYNYLLFLVCLSLTALFSVDAVADKMVKVRVVVRNLDGDPVSGARVSIWHDWSGIGLSAPLGDWSRPADYQGESNSKGIASFMIPAKTEFKDQGAGERAFGRTVKIEVYKTGYSRGDDTIKFATVAADIPEQIVRQINIDGREPQEIKAEDMTVLVKVQRYDTKDPVEGAVVKVFLNTPFLRREFSAATDRNGDARIIANLYNDFEIVVTKENFAPKRRTIVLKKAEKVNGPHSIILERNVGAEITVNVRNRDSNLPVGDANVIFDGVSSYAYHTATTDSGGKATLFIPEIGIFKVKVSQDFYEPLAEEVRLLQGEERKTVDLFLKAKPKKDQGKDTITVNVIEKAADGDKLPVSGATVGVHNTNVSTDSDGQGVLTGTFDDEVDVTISAPGFKTQTKHVRVPKLARYSGGSLFLKITLVREASADSTPINLVVEAIDADTQKPIAGASVFLRFNRNIVGEGNTDARGDVAIEIQDRADAPLARLRQGIQVDVYARNYDPHLTDINADLLKPSAETRRFVIFLKRNWRELKEALKLLEQKVFTWNADAKAATAATSKMKALLESTIAAEKRAREIVSAIKETVGQIFGMSVAPGISSANMVCQKAKRIKESIQDKERNADQKEKDLTKKLTDVENIVIRCTTPQDAEAIKKAYSEAIKLAAEIGVLEKAAVNEESELAKLAEDAVGLKPILNAAQKRLSDVDKEIQLVEDAASSADTIFKNAKNMGGGLVGRRDALSKELTTLKADHGITEQPQELPVPISRSLLELELILGSRNSDIFFLMGSVPSQKPINDIAQKKSAIQQVKIDGEKLLAQYATSLCKVEPMKDTLENMGSMTTSATIELSAAADLPAKADDCAKLGKCRPLIDAIRLLMQQIDISSAKTKIDEARTQGCDVTQVQNELAYWDWVAKSVDYMKKMGELCRFQEAISWAAQIPKDTSEKGLIKDGISKLNTGLTAQKDTAQRLEKARAAAVAKNTSDFNRFVDEATKIAQFYPCLLADVEKLKREQPTTVTTTTSTTDTATTTSSPSSKWPGNYQRKLNDGEATIAVFISNMQLTASESWKDGKNSGTATWSKCKVTGNTAKCNFVGTFNGPDKYGTRRGVIEVQVNDDGMTGTYFEDEPSFTWLVKPYATPMRKGAVWPVTWKRKK